MSAPQIPLDLGLVPGRVNWQILPPKIPDAWILGDRETPDPRETVERLARELANKTGQPVTCFGYGVRRDADAFATDFASIVATAVVYPDITSVASTERGPV